MNKIGIYYAYWTHDWDADFNPFVDKTADLGFDILQVNAGTIAYLKPEEWQALKSHADDRDICLSYWIGLPKQYDIASEEVSVRQTGIDFLHKIAGAIGDMGGGTLGGIIYSYWPGSLPAGVTDKRPYIERSSASMQEAIKTAEENNVFFNMDVVNRLWFRSGASALGVTWLCGTPPFSGVPWYPPSVSSGNASSRVAVVRAHKDKNGSYASCTDLPGALSADGIEGRTGNQCGGLPGILALKRNSTRCPNENTNYMGFEWAHIKYYLQK